MRVKRPLKNYLLLFFARRTEHSFPPCSAIYLYSREMSLLHSPQFFSSSTRRPQGCWLSKRKVFSSGKKEEKQIHRHMKLLNLSPYSPINTAHTSTQTNYDAVSGDACSAIFWRSLILLFFHTLLPNATYFWKYIPLKACLVTLFHTNFLCKTSLLFWRYATSKGKFIQHCFILFYVFSLLILKKMCSKPDFELWLSRSNWC